MINYLGEMITKPEKYTRAFSYPKKSKYKMGKG